MAATTYFQNRLLDYSLRQQTFSVNQWYIGLWLTDPTAAGLLTGEVTASDYTRRAVNFNSSFQNIGAIVWDAATSQWGTINYVALVDTQAKATGNVCAYEPPNSPQLVDVGNIAQISAGGLTVTIA